MAPDQPELRGLNSASLEHLRNILITSLPQENIGEHDRKFIKQKTVSFRTGELILRMITCLKDCATAKDVVVDWARDVRGA